MSSPPRPTLSTTVLYRRFPGFTFDLSYYLSHHIPLALKYWEPHGALEHYVTKVGDEEAEFAYVITMVWRDEVSRMGWM